MPLTALLLVLVAVTVGCGPAASPSTAVGRLEVLAVAGPVCPVETEPPDPACEPRPVAGAPVFVSPGDGRDILVVRGETDPHGRLTLEVPVGSYIVAGGEAQGLFGLPEPVQVTVRSGETTVTLAYDTGIR